MSDEKTRAARPAGSIFVCNCEQTMSVDAKGLARGLGLAAEPVVYENLCRRQIAAYEKALDQGEPIIVACTQEAPLFAEIADEREARSAPVDFVNIREHAGWSADPADKTPKMAALIEAAALRAEPTGAMTIRSEGQCLVYGSGQQIIDAAEHLAKRLDVTVVMTAAEDAIVPSRAEVPLHAGEIRSVTGALGHFNVSIDRFAPIKPSSRRVIEFESPRDGFSTTCDIILDLSGGRSLVNDTVERDGYIRVDPGNPAALGMALFKAADLVGEFEKPLYVTYDASICAHGRSAKIGCRNCIDTCPTGAIASDGDTVAIDAAVCGGCGGCGAVCPTGAINYDYPARGDLIQRVQRLAETYRKAGGEQPVLLILDEDHGTNAVDLIARFGRGLPANVLPLPVYSVFQVGHDMLVSALAAGFAQVAIIVPPAKAYDMPALTSQVALADAFTSGLGFEAGRTVIIDDADPDAIEAALYDLGEPPAIAAPPFAPLGGKRDIARLALGALNSAASAPREVIALPDDAPYGTLVIDADNCTLCLACVGACPTGALGDGADRPRLSFTEQACVQCGLCRVTCPEGVIALEPRYNFTKSILEPVTIKEEEPFECISCGKPFGAKSSVERIIARLEGKHAMFQSQQQTDLIRMCDNCRVVALAERGGDPMTMGERPKVRTTDDYIIARDEGRALDDDEA